MIKPDAKLSYWQTQSPDINGMLLNPDAAEIDEHERTQILESLPSLSGKSILELGAGIGRFTQHFASTADAVYAVDFNQNFIDRNQEINSAFNNISYKCSDVMQLEFAGNSFDFLFINWLLMYLEDDQVETLQKRIGQWLKPGGQMFFRESCITDSKGNMPQKDSVEKGMTNHAHSHYRDPEFYLDVFLGEFELEKQGNIAIYEQKYNNPNQLFFLLTRL